MVKVIVLLSALLTVTGSLVVKACANERFPFKSYERRLAPDADISGATRDLKAHLPVGSPISGYENIFKDVGGECEVLEDPEDPNTMLSTYSHGLLVISKWMCVVTFDPSTKTSTDVVLNFGLTGL
jgi:hypothetical protein